MQQRSHPHNPFVSASAGYFIISPKSAWSWVRLGCVTLCFATWLGALLFVQGSPKTPIDETAWPMSSERWDVTNSHGWFSCPYIRGWFCGGSVKFVRGRRSLSYSRMIGRIIVVQICWTHVGLRFLRFLSMGVTWLSFSNLFGWVVGGMACFFRVSCQTLRFTVWCKAWDVLFRTCPMMISTQFRFFLKAGASVRCGIPCPSSEGDSWGGVWRPTYGTEMCVKFAGWVEPIRVTEVFFFYLAEVCMKLGAVRLCCFVFRYMIGFFIVRSRVTKDTHWRNHITHVLWKVGCDPLAWGIFVSNIRVWFCGWSVKFVRGGPSLSYS